MKFLNIPIRETDADGFSLIEVLVAIFIGLIVMTVAVATLSATNATSLRILSKSEAQQGTRDAMINVYDKAANAEGLQICRVAFSEADQTKIKDQPLGDPQIDPLDCKETASSGFVVAVAQPNRFCYFKSEKETGGTDFLPNKKPTIQCMARGGQKGAIKRYSSTTDVEVPVSASVSQTPNSVVSIAQCLNNFDWSDTTEYDLISYSCEGTSTGNLIDWPASYSYASGSKRIIADLNRTTKNPDIDENLFTYIRQSDPDSQEVSVPNLSSIIGIKVSTATFYIGHNASQDDKYYFSHTIVLRGSQYFQEEKLRND